MIGAAVDAALPFMRDAATSLMVDTVEVSAEGAATWDPVTESYVADSVVLYAGPGRELPARQSSPDVADAAGQMVRDLTVVVAVPWDVDVSGITGETVVTVTGSPAPGRVGRVLRVRAVATSTHQVEVRLLCEAQEAGQ